MESKFCPLLSINQSANQPCQRSHCALWVDMPGNEGGCALAVLAEGTKEAASKLFDIAARMP